tara:strand:- start:61 stop:585 length:525 start_codon:yes stop_codon:yes gene_type:complete
MKKGVLIINAGFPTWKNRWHEDNTFLILPENFTNLLQEQIPVSFAFLEQYNEVEFQQAIQFFQQENVKQVLVLILFPQFAKDSMEGSVNDIKTFQKEHFSEITCTFWTISGNYPGIPSESGNFEDDLKEKGSFVSNGSFNVIGIPTLINVQNLVDVLLYWIEQWVLTDHKTAIA